MVDHRTPNREVLCLIPTGCTLTTPRTGYTLEALWLHPGMTEKLLTGTINLKTIKGFHEYITNLNNNIRTTTSKCIHVGSVLGCSRLVFNVHKHTTILLTRTLRNEVACNGIQMTWTKEQITPFELPPWYCHLQY